MSEKKSEGGLDERVEIAEGVWKALRDVTVEDAESAAAMHERRAAELSDNTVKCSRCGRRVGSDLEGWNGEFQQGVLVAIICPTCQSGEENAEAEINESTTAYGVSGGRVTGRGIGC